MKRIMQKVSKRKDNSSIKTSKTLSSITHWNKDIAILYDPNTKKFYKDSYNDKTILTTKSVEDKEPFQLVPLPKSGGTMPLVIKAKNTDRTIDMGVVDLQKLGKTINFHRMCGNVDSLYILGEIELPS
ncbi:hypothetical protein BP6252_13089 [Coleophoma cylindrospora]|uniref:Uncharacterized protein n=1 Tax=Coleophoma cylindrospora TaxID=1849047 RepID=A0A3D8Q9U7_9HELO|nr:hypothetical protein BP6252_13089 [Coleophoma cylindrospora]